RQTYRIDIRQTSRFRLRLAEQQGLRILTVYRAKTLVKLARRAREPDRRVHSGAGRNWRSGSRTATARIAARRTEGQRSVSSVAFCRKILKYGTDRAALARFTRRQAQLTPTRAAHHNKESADVVR